MVALIYALQDVLCNICMHCCINEEGKFGEVKILDKMGTLVPLEFLEAIAVYSTFGLNASIHWKRRGFI